MKQILAKILPHIKETIRYIRDEKYFFITLAAIVVSTIFPLLTGFFCNTNKSIVNPFIQGLWFYLALFGIALFAGKIAGRCILITLFLAQGLLTIISCFLICTFHLELTADTFFVLAASSKSEVQEFFAYIMSPFTLLWILFGTAAIVAGIILICKAKFTRTRYAMLLAFLLTLPYLINVIRFSVRGDYEDIVNTPGIPELVQNYFLCRNNYSRFIRMEQNPRLPEGIRRESPQQKIVGVFVIGESASRAHMGIYGYPRQTTPVFSAMQSELVVFDDMVSLAGDTVSVLRYMLTTADHANPYNLQYTLFDVLNASGYQTSLISKQTAWGDHDGPIALFTAHAMHREYIHKTQPFALDDACLDPLKRTLAEGKAPQFITVHIMGSHTQFEHRYPKEFARFDGMDDEVSRNTPEKWREETDFYDNSILFTDFILGKMIDELKTLKDPAFFVYLSDHGESVASDIKRSAASSNRMVYEVPFIFWANDAYRKAFPDVMAAAAKNCRSAMQNDSIFYSILAAANVTFDGFPAEHNVFSGKFRSPEKRFMGKREYQSQQKQKDENSI